LQGISEVNGKMPDVFLREIKKESKPY